MTTDTETQTQSAAVSPSAGCGSGGAGTPTVANAIVGLPQGYDGMTPGPVVFAFHAANNDSDQLQKEYGNTVLGKNYVMIYGAAQNRSGWTMQNDKGRFNTMYEETMQKLCVDQNRVYATGHSSGSQFIVQLLCDGESRFKAVAPVASSAYCQKWSPIPSLIIHGQNDTERASTNQDADGTKDLAPYLASNTCEMTTTPSNITTSGCSGSVDPGCVEYQGCSETTIWCHHNDPNYRETQHGIPCFAEAAIDDFFSQH